MPRYDSSKINELKYLVFPDNLWNVVSKIAEMHFHEHLHSIYHGILHYKYLFFSNII